MMVGLSVPDRSLKALGRAHLQLADFPAICIRLKILSSDYQPYARGKNVLGLDLDQIILFTDRHDMGQPAFHLTKDHYFKGYLLKGHNKCLAELIQGM